MICLLAPALASAQHLSGSIAYTSRQGDLWRLYPRTGRRVLLAGHTASRVYRLATQDDGGDVVTTTWPGRQWALFVGRGHHPRPRVFNSVATGFPLVANLQTCQSALAGPLDPRLAPDGRALASWAVAQDVQPAYPPGQTPTGYPPCTSNTLGGAIVQLPDRDRAFSATSQLGELGWPSFYRGDGLLVADLAGSGPTKSGLYYIAPGQGTPQQWFSGDGLPLIEYPVINRQMTQMAFAVGGLTASGESNGRDVALGFARLAGPPPALPAFVCQAPVVSGHGNIESLDWSPDGKLLMWTDSRGVWIARVSIPASGQGVCALTSQTLVAPGGSGSTWSRYGR